MPITTRDGLFFSASMSGRYWVVGRRSMSKNRAVWRISSSDGSAGPGRASSGETSNPALRMKCIHAACESVAVERVNDGFGVRALLRGVGQQLQERRLVCDERTHPSRMPGDQSQAGDRPSAGPEQVG